MTKGRQSANLERHNALSHSKLEVLREYRETNEVLLGYWLRQSGTDRTGAFVVVTPEYSLSWPPQGTSTGVFDSRAFVVAVDAGSTTSVTVEASAPLVAPADQMREIQATLSLNKSQLAAMLRISRPTLYEWLDGSEPNDANADRLASLTQLLSRAGISSNTPLNARFVRRPVEDGSPSVLEALSAEHPDEQQILQLLAMAQQLDDEAALRRENREARLQELGYQPPSENDGFWSVGGDRLSEKEFRLRFVEIKEDSTKEFVDPKIEILRHENHVEAIDPENGLRVKRATLKEALEALEDKKRFLTFLYESAYYVSRGAKPRCFETTETLFLEEIKELLDTCSYSGAHPYIIKYEEGFEFGYITEPWIVDVLLYIKDAPFNIQKAINGILCGYEPAAIQSLISEGLGARKRPKGNLIFRELKT